MQYIYNILQQHYSIKPKNLYKHRYSYIFEHNNQLYNLHTTTENKSSIIFQNDIKSYLHNKKFSNIDSFMLTIDNLPFVINNQDVFVATKFYLHNNINFSDKEITKRALQKIALMHKNLSDISLTDTARFKNPIEQILQDISYIKSIYKKLRKKTTYSDIDVYFINNYNYYIRLIMQCFDKLIGYNPTIDLHNQVCHGTLKEDFILFDNNDIFITVFNNCNVSPHVLDLNYFIKRYIKSLPSSYLTLKEIIYIYSKYNTNVTRDDIIYLNYFLKYPDRFINLCREYYNKNIPFQPNVIINKLDNIINNNNLYNNYLEGGL